ncbi:hypothetical protein AAE478_003195 [Parahypoxylon ruwenzoriense]
MKLFLLMMAVTAMILPIETATTTEDGEPIETVTESSAATHTVRVGLQHDFQPDTIQANPGDTIRFNFYPKNHSVVRADFKKPCIPWELTNDPVESFFSGPVEQETLQSPIPTWDLKNRTFTLDIQKQFVVNSTFQLSPGEEFPDEASPSSTPTSTATNSPTPAGESRASSLSGGAIAGIAIGGTAVVVIAVALVYLCGRKGGIEKGYRRSKLTNVAPPEIVEANYHDNGLKSPPMGSPYTMTYAEPYRSPSSAAWSSQVGSPHNSYLGHASPGMPPYSGGSPPMPSQGQQPFL